MLALEFDDPGPIVVAERGSMGIDLDVFEARHVVEERCAWSRF
jgi:hypothetical protein